MPLGTIVRIGEYQREYSGVMAPGEAVVIDTGIHVEQSDPPDKIDVIVVTDSPGVNDPVYAVTAGNTHGFTVTNAGAFVAPCIVRFAIIHTGVR